MARKRLFDEIEDLEKIENPVSNAIVHGVVTSLSPIKKGRTTNYFDGSISDGTAKIRMIGFNSSQQKVMKQFMDNKEVIQLQDCMIKQVRRGDKMEVMLKGTTQILKSPKKCDVSSVDFEDNAPFNISLADIDSYSVFDRVTVNVKVLSCADPITVAGDKQKQDLNVADSSGVCKVVLWAEHIGTLEKNSSYTLHNFVIREYAGLKFLSMSKDGSEISPTSDIGNVVEGDTSEHEETITNVVIIAVLQLDTYRSCLRCKARVEPCSPPLGRCSKFECAMLQRFDICPEHTSAKLLCNTSESNMKSILAFGQTVQDLACVADNSAITDEALLKSPPTKSMTIDKNNVIVKFER